MNKPKFTPGPLTIKRSLSSDNTGGYDYAIIDEAGQIIAETYEHVGVGRELGAVYDKRPARANAVLFAAAPDLYEALLDPDNKEKREAALAKARGEAPAVATE